MNNFLEKTKNVVLWLTPSGVEIAFYIFLTFASFVLSSFDLVKSSLSVTGDFNPIRSGIGVVDSLLQHFVGEKVAGSLSLAIFWGLIGLTVNVIWWLGSNFSTELNNDLVFSKYVHPKDTDPREQLRVFAIRTVIRTIVAISGILYLNFFLSDGLPRLSTRYAAVIGSWSNSQQYLLATTTILFQILMLHIFIVLIRLILLRKKAFDS
ncbi:MAG: hypothetical protein NTX11_03365 [Candidatus Saccharibacteria bacterium]|nr:hypothetical protein [Candidatus Saccharibacteria bacterium]